jgi:hypothetical protein
MHDTLRAGFDESVAGYMQETSKLPKAAPK